MVRRGGETIVLGGGYMPCVKGDLFLSNVLGRGIEHKKKNYIFWFIFVLILLVTSLRLKILFIECLKGYRVD